jgi:hypothetical protein
MSPSSKQRRRFRLDGTVDIECAGWDRFVCGAVYRPIDGARIVRSPDDLVDELLRRDGWYWAWCGGRYDFLLIADVLHKRGRRVVCHTAGSQITRLQVGSLSLVDAWFLCPMSKNEAAPIAKRPPSVLGWPCICRPSPDAKECGGYCQISTKLPPDKMRQLEAYCADDAALEYAVLAELVGFGTELGLDFRGTLGGTAWATAQGTLGLPIAAPRSSVWNRLKTASYGGRVTVGMPRAQRGRQHDIASAYPAALATTAVPIGEPVELGARRAALAYNHGTEGVYRATVRVPEDLWLPPLPWRREGRVAYPTGRFTGAWVKPELEAAEARGVVIEEITAAYAYPDGACVVFDELIGRWYDARARVGRDSALGKWIRLLANALTGKLAEGPHREMVLMHPRQVRYCNPDSEVCRRAGCTRIRCTGRCKAYRQLDRWGTIFSVPYFRKADSGHVVWAAYLTAATRLRELEGMEAVGDRFVYGDTDSVWTSDPEVAFTGDQGELLVSDEKVPGPVGERMGQWVYRGRWYDWHCLAPKSYRYATEQEVVVRAAGVAHASDYEWRTLDGRQQALEQGRGVMSLREAAMGDKGLFRRRFRPVTPREFDGWYGDRLLHLDGRTYPADRGQIEKRYREQRSRRIRQNCGQPATGPGELHPGQGQAGAAL